MLSSPCFSAFQEDEVHVSGGCVSVVSLTWKQVTDTCICVLPGCV